MNYFDVFNYWKNSSFFDNSTKEELNSLDETTDCKEIEDRFYRDLEFGTGGLRGIMAAGTNRFNSYTVGKATKGLGDYLQSTFGEKAKQKGVAIGYDTRNHSREFAEIAANVLSNQGIKVFLLNAPLPTPLLSFAVRHFNAIAGIVITASHNPKEYNGYKVYDENGCQLVPSKANEVIKFVNAVKDYTSISLIANRRENIFEVNCTDSFIDAVLSQSLNHNISSKGHLHIIYTPLHGTGLIPVTQTLKKAGFSNLKTVKEQCNQDGNFPSVVSPNPEDKKALNLGIQQATKEDADIVLGTDPDCDRVGVAVKTSEGFQLITGNQIGALLVDYVLNHSDLTKFSRPCIVKTEVTSELGAIIAKKKGIQVFSTLTGFKFIGEKITQFEKSKLENNPENNFDFVVGYEESYGYLIGTHSRDKDAVVASLLICEMAAEYKEEGKSLIDRLNELYKEFGYYKDALDSFTLKGIDGQEKIVALMKQLRTKGSPFKNTIKTIDYLSPIKTNNTFEKLPLSNVLKFILDDGSWVAVRPSGTEPKIKIYYSIKAKDKTGSERALKELQETVRKELNL